MRSTRGMILAAGLGTRLRPLTDKLPKPCIPLLNVPLGLWPLQHLLDAGVTDLIVNTHHLPEKIESLFQSQAHKLRGLKFSSEKAKILGSGGGISKAKSFLEQEENFWVANGDEVFLPAQSETFLDAWKLHIKNQALATLVVIKHAEVGKKFGGVWVDKTGSVRGFGKEAPEPGLSGFHYTGFQIISSKVFKYFPPGDIESNIFYDTYTRAIMAGEKIQIASAWGDWFETGNQEDLLIATRELLELASSNPNLQSFLVKNGAGNLKNGFLIHPKASVDPKATLSGFVVVGRDAVVPAGINIKNSVILPGSRVEQSVEGKIL